MNLTCYGLTKDQQIATKKKFSKWKVIFMSGVVSKTNLSPRNTEILSIHANSVITNHVISQLPKLKLIITRTTGYDHIDIGACKRENIKIVNCAGLNAESVAEFTFGLLLSLIRGITNGVEQGRKLDFSKAFLNGAELDGKTIGIIGTGAIGSRVAVFAKAFGMSIVGFDSHKNQKLVKQTSLKYMSLKQVVGRSDVITLHVPATPLTEHMVNAKLLANIKKGAVIINTARGSVVNTGAVLQALSRGKLGGYAADVIEHETQLLLRAGQVSPKDKKEIALDKLLAKHPKVLLTPHMAHATIESTNRIFAYSIEQILKYSKGQKINTII